MSYLMIIEGLHCIFKFILCRIFIFQLRPFESQLGLLKSQDVYLTSPGHFVKDTFNAADLSMEGEEEMKAPRFKSPTKIKGRVGRELWCR